MEKSNFTEWLVDFNEKKQKQQIGGIGIWKVPQTCL